MAQWLERIILGFWKNIFVCKRFLVPLCSMAYTAYNVSKETSSRWIKQDEFWEYAFAWVTNENAIQK